MTLKIVIAKINQFWTINVSAKNCYNDNVLKLNPLCYKISFDTLYYPYSESNICDFSVIITKIKQF